MATVTSGNLNFVLDEIATVVMFEEFYDATDFLMPYFFSIRPSKKRRERSASIGGLSRYEVKAETQSAAEDSISQQFEKDYVHSAYSKQIPVSRELIDDEEWGTFAEIAQELGVKAAESMEEDGAGVFNNAFGSVLCEDGLSLCNGAHVNAQGGNSQSNSGTAALTAAGIKSTRTAMRKFTNYRGGKMSIRPDLLAVPVDIEEEAWEIVRSAGKLDTSNNNMNMYNGMFALAVWDWMTDVNAWFMIDRRRMARNLFWFQRVSFESFGDGNLFSGTKRVGGYYRASFGARDWRWVYGNNPS